MRVVYVAYGNKAEKEVVLAIEDFNRYNNYPITVICKTPLTIPRVNFVTFDDPRWGARWAKLNVNNLVDDDTICYLDVDTRVNGDIAPAFNMVKNGWDMVMAYSMNQDNQCMLHIGEDEKKETLINNPFPLQYQCGVMFFNRIKCMSFFEAWRTEWLKYGEKDQAAFMRALHIAPIKIALLGRPWNGGSVIQHLFGRAHG